MEHPFKVGDLVTCKSPTPTTTKGGVYKVRGVFSYINKCTSYEDHWWSRSDFITIKNDKGYTVKVNSLNFKISQ